ncbi:MAG: cysteine--tRNA ligase [Patescibacteria group bacterium]|nr:cysteine--tRNA ligase [Patescibacteria group bacterium]
MNKIILYNTLTREKEEFKPIKKGKVGFYHCGPTVYWTQHIGNMRGMTCADVIVRTLKYSGYDVTHIRNYTDVGHLTSDEDEGEDKMEKGAKREGLSPDDIARKYIKIFEQDTAALNILEPNIKARATEHVPEMIKMAESLISKGYAYATDLAIYFDVNKFKDYGNLSGQRVEDKESGAGKGEVSDPQKRNPEDFAVWFFRAGAHKNALQFWPSPFQSPLVENGNGFPGWHIECSAMSKKYLGDTIDIHMGGIEHIPVHHTNEIAQSEAANGVKFVNYWIHNNHLVVNDCKMAKSEGTCYSVEEVREKGFDPIVLRYFFLGAHYRAKQNFTWEALLAARNGFEHLRNQIRDLRFNLPALPTGQAGRAGNSDLRINENFKNIFLEKINDDFNMPEALAVMQEVLKSDLSAGEKLGTIFDFDKVFGLNLAGENNDLPLPEEIQKLIINRQQARKDKNFSESDRLRDEIEKLGFTVEDSKEGMRVYKK